MFTTLNENSDNYVFFTDKESFITIFKSQVEESKKHSSINNPLIVKEGEELVNDLDNIPEEVVVFKLTKSSNTDVVLIFSPPVRKEQKTRQYLSIIFKGPEGLIEFINSIADEAEKIVPKVVKNLPTLLFGSSDKFNILPDLYVLEDINFLISTLNDVVTSIKEHSESYANKNTTGTSEA